MKKITFIAILIFSSLFNSCLKKDDGQKTKIQTNKPAREKRQLPKSLDALDLSSENIYQYILNKDWGKSKQGYNKVQEEFYKLSPYLIEDSIPTDYIVALEKNVDNLQKDIESKDLISALTDANNITAYNCDVADYFVTDFPSNLRRIHVYTRNVEIEVLQANWDNAKKEFSKVPALWPKVKPLLTGKSTQKVKEFDDSLVDFEYMLSKKDLNKTLRQTQIIRDRTDALERFYEADL